MENILISIIAIYSLEEKRLEFNFKEWYCSRMVLLQFNEVVITKFGIDDWVFPLTLDLFYRGRYMDDGNLFETTEKGEQYFYLDFLSGDHFELFTRQVILKIYTDGETN